MTTPPCENTATACENTTTTFADDKAFETKLIAETSAFVELASTSPFASIRRKVDADSSSPSTRLESMKHMVANINDAYELDVKGAYDWLYPLTALPTVLCEMIARYHLPIKPRVAALFAPFNIIKTIMHGTIDTPWPTDGFAKAFQIAEAERCILRAEEFFWYTGSRGVCIRFNDPLFGEIGPVDLWNMVHQPDVATSCHTLFQNIHVSYYEFPINMFAFPSSFASLSYRSPTTINTQPP